MNKYSLSVVIPAYNSGKTISACLESVIGQKPYEVIVVDDGSNDETGNIAKKTKGIKLLKHKRNLGLAAARNTGVRTARGDIILFIDSDCEADRNLVGTVLASYKDGVDGVGGRGIETGSSMADRWRQLTGGQSHGKKKKIRVPFLFGLCSSYRRQVLLEAGLFDTTFRTNGEDVDMGLRLNKMDKTLVYEPDAKVVHHRRDDFWSLTRMVYRAYKFGYMAYLKNRGFWKTFRVFAMSVPGNFLKGLRLVAEKSGSKLAHLGLVISAFFAEAAGFASAIVARSKKRF